MKEPWNLVDEHGVVHQGVSFARRFVVCDHEHETMLQLREQPTREPVTCILCVYLTRNK